MYKYTVRTYFRIGYIEILGHGVLVVLGVSNLPDSRLHQHNVTESSIITVPLKSADIPRSAFEHFTVRLLRPTAGISASAYDTRPSLSSP